MMWNRSLREILIPTCLMALFLTPPSESFQLGGHKGGNLGDLLTASIIGLAIGGVRDRLKKQQQEQKPLSSQQPIRASANHQHARFMPIPLQGMMPMQGPIPLMQASQLMPTFQQQMFQSPFMSDMSPFLMWSPEEAFAPMASHLMHSVLAQQPLNALNGGLPTLDSFGDMSTIQQQWQALESQAFRTILAYGAQ